MKKIVEVFRTGLISYQNGLNIQKYFISVYNNSADFKTFKNILILAEHKPVYTIGIRSKNYTIKDEEKLKSFGAEFYKTDRGGLITFHGPGQLILYPILHLKLFKPSVRWYVNSLEETVISTCNKFGIKAIRTEHTGIWIGSNKKICAIGIHVSQYKTSHGIALNCNTDLKWFEHIIPCGIEDKYMTSLSRELNRNITIDMVIPKLLDSFSEIFECKVVKMNLETSEPKLFSV
ncbi:putative lipoyltransferase 2, mitochondrial [Condylostylus longicornis]|uniref:putative lipoyltransferase 2, mitochondrial n=1 Tax=Condylostylus longicornis TaxID=2530218 RepID=UPI00244E1A3E|nr:putative lipoyltransferase 2, mitochondrial [Condylostylus longicornis]